jgi:hypothetical protein
MEPVDPVKKLGHLLYFINDDLTDRLTCRELAPK